MTNNNTIVNSAVQSILFVYILRKETKIINRLELFEIEAININDKTTRSTVYRVIGREGLRKIERG